MHTESGGLELVYRVSGIASSGIGLEPMLAQIISLIAKAVHCDVCIVEESVAETGGAVLRASRSPHDAMPARFDLDAAGCAASRVSGEGAVVAAERQAGDDPRFKPVPGFVDGNHQALLSVPLVAGGAVLGAVNAYFRGPLAHTPADVALLSFAGEQIGMAIAAAAARAEAARLRESVLKLESELETRKLVERAKGILQRDGGITEEEAYLKLRAESRRTRKPMRELAEAVILADAASRAASEGS